MASLNWPLTAFVLSALASACGSGSDAVDLNGPVRHDAGDQVGSDGGITADAGNSAMTSDDAGERDAGSVRPVSGDAEPYFVGRFDHAHFTGARYAWSGSAVSARFRGTRVDAELADDGDNQFYVLLDGKVLKDKLVPGSGHQTVTLASGLAPGEHDVTLYKLTEATVGESEFFAFVVPDGELLPYFKASERQIELIGDSISAGYGDEGENKDCPFSPGTENHYLSYGALAARALSAELVTTAWSGKGVFSNRGSSEDTLPMPPLWRRTLPDRDDSAWDFALHTPDVVVVNLGTNDLAPENTDQAPFADKYQAFVSEVRTTYPEAVIFCTQGPLLSDFWPENAMTLTRARKAIQGSVEAFNMRGDSKVFYLEYPLVMEDSEGYGCDYHPSLKTHARMAEQLAAAISEQLAW